MQPLNIYTTLESIPDAVRNAVLVIGNFDGVHKGHQALIAAARDRAVAAELPLGVLTFDPHPRRLFRPDDPPFQLTTPDIRAERLAACGVDFIVQLGFDWDFASLSAEDFIRRILRDGLGVSQCVVGNDFCFGQLRKGNAETLIHHGIETIVLEKIADEGDGPLSSSAIRQSLRAGDMGHAESMLGAPWEIRGTVCKGDQRGRTLGYPTANVKLGSVLHPAYGVYAARVQVMEDGADSPWYASATNIGIRPMFALPEGQVEAHILDFDRDIYGKTLRVRPVARLRGEAKFETLEDLINQIGLDCMDARRILRGLLT